MTSFTRARTPAQKELRMTQIKDEARRQFVQRPYHEITLTTLADGLGWSRANLYKYVTTKEEIFLLLAEDERDAYFDALLAAMPAGSKLSATTISEVWGGIAAAHQQWFRLSHLLMTIIETNVSVERLTVFKRNYFAKLEEMQQQLPSVLDITPEQLEPLLLSISYHAEGLVSRCTLNPLVVQALDALGRKPAKIDFRAEMVSFIRMCLVSKEK